MKNEIKKIISILLIALLVIFTTNVYAANDSFGTTITASSVQVKRGNTITITIGLKDIAIESGEKGIGAYTAKIDFDSSVLEYVSTNGTDKWESPFYQDGLITGNTKDGNVVKDNMSIGTITFKVKDNAKLGDTTISLTNFSGSTAVTDVDAKNLSTKITIISDNTSDGNTIDNTIGGNTIGGNTTNNNNTNNNGNKPTNTVDNSIKDGNLPKTGTIDVIVYAAIGTFVVIGTIFFIKMKNANIR